LQPYLIIINARVFKFFFQFPNDIDVSQSHDMVIHFFK
jgi:hypothetical protein